MNTKSNSIQTLQLFHSGEETELLMIAHDYAYYPTKKEENKQ